MRPRLAATLVAMSICIATMGMTHPVLGADRVSGTPRSTTLGSTVVLSWTDLGMHCMNQNHAAFSVLPPYDTLCAQVVQCGDATHTPQVLTSGVTLEYSAHGIPVTPWPDKDLITEHPFQQALVTAWDAGGGGEERPVGGVHDGHDPVAVRD